MPTPTSNIKLLSNIDIKADYKHSFTFNSSIEQLAFFNSKTILTNGNVSYIRKDNVFRYEGNVSEIRNVNYIVYQNPDYENKYFFAFVTNVVYINSNMAHLQFEIDVIQTWLFELDFKNSHIEREHVANDTIGIHTTDENLNVGDYIITDVEEIDSLKDLVVVVGVTEIWDGVNNTWISVVGNNYSGIYSAIKYYSFNFQTSPTALNDFVYIYNDKGKIESIVAMFLMVKSFTGALNPPDGYEIPNLSQPIIDTFSITKPLSFIDNYTPKNNKMFVYPYNFFTVTNNNGGDSIYKYENFKNADCEFTVKGDISPSTTAFLIPYNYREGNGSLLDDINDEQMRLTGFPQVAWNNDVYKTWLAQNSSSIALGLASSGLAIGIGVSTANPIAIASGVLSVANTIGTFYEKSIIPQQVKGSIGGGSQVAVSQQTFTFYKKQIKQEYAKIIDEYFSMYGYKVNRIGTPILQTRAYWNYIKLNEANIYGNINTNDLTKVKSIFETGITLWHDNNVANYNRANSII